MRRHGSTGRYDRAGGGALNRRQLVGSAAALGLAAAALRHDRSFALQDDVSGEITVWTWPDNDKTFEQTVPIFESKYPGVKVKVQAFSGNEAGGNPYHAKLLTAMVSGSGPDVAMVEIGNVAKFKDKPGFVDLRQAPYEAAEFASQYAGFAWSYVTDATTGRVFALPKNTGPGAMFYRRDRFEKAGLPTDPGEVHELLKTWDDYLAVGKELTVEGEQWMASSIDRVFAPIVAQSGVSYFNEAGELQLQDPAFRTALEYAKRAADEGIASPIADWSEEWGAALQSGSVATHLWGNWFGGLLKSVYAPDTGGKWGVTFAPEMNGASAYNSGGDFIGILESSKNKPAAWAFVRFVTQNADSLRTMFASNDLYPAWQPVLTEPWINEADSFYAGQNVNTIFAPVSAAMKPPVTNPNDPVIETVMASVLTGVRAGKLSVNDALKEAEEQIKAKIG